MLRRRKHTVLSFESNLKVESERTKKETIHKKREEKFTQQKMSAHHKMFCDLNYCELDY
jgi:hypothetical protein